MRITFEQPAPDGTRFAPDAFSAQGSTVPLSGLAGVDACTVVDVEVIDDGAALRVTVEIPGDDPRPAGAAALSFGFADRRWPPPGMYLKESPPYTLRQGPYGAGYYRQTEGAVFRAAERAAADESPYDVDTGLTRLRAWMDGWMDGQPDDPSRTADDGGGQGLEPRCGRCWAPLRRDGDQWVTAEAVASSRCLGRGGHEPMDEVTLRLWTRTHRPDDLARIDDARRELAEDIPDDPEA